MLVEYACGAPAGIDELVETRIAAGFSRQARQWHGCKAGQGMGAVIEGGIPLTIFDTRRTSKFTGISQRTSVRPVPFDMP